MITGRLADLRIRTRDSRIGRAVTEALDTLKYGRLVVRDNVEGHEQHLNSCLNGCGINERWVLGGEVVHSIRAPNGEFKFSYDIQRLPTTEVEKGEYALEQIPEMLRTAGVAGAYRLKNLSSLWYDYRSSDKRMRGRCGRGYNFSRRTVLVRGLFIPETGTDPPGSYNFQVVMREKRRG